MPGGNVIALAAEAQRLELNVANHTIKLLSQTDPLANAINHSLAVMTASNSPKAASELIKQSDNLPKQNGMINFNQLLKLRNEYRHDPNTTLTETELYCYYQDNKDDLTEFIRSLTTH